MATVMTSSVRRLYIESDTERPELIELASGHVAALCRRCPGKVEPNEDSAAVVQTTWGAIVLIVADGVGGCPQGYKASSVAVHSVAESVLAADQGRDLRPAVLDGIERANNEILDLGIGAATTIAIVEIQDRTARSYQVGDSVSLILGQRGAIKWQSTPHSPVGYAVKSGILDETDAMHHDERHIVSNLVGSRSMHIEVGPSQRLAVRDTVIVASDGLFDNLHLDEIVQRGRCGRLEKRMESLLELASQRMSSGDTTQPGKPDDLTVLMFALRHARQQPLA